MTEGKCKDKDAAVKEITVVAKKYDVKVTKQKTTVTEKNARSLLGAIIRDINQDEGAGRKGWWSNYTVVNEKDLFCFKTKPSKQATA